MFKNNLRTFEVEILKIFLKNIRPKPKNLNGLIKKRVWGLLDFTTTTSTRLTNGTLDLTTSRSLTTSTTS